MVKWQTRSRPRRSGGLNLALSGLALAGAGVLAADLLGGLDLTGAAAFVPVLLALPWTAQAVVGVVRASLDAAPDSALSR
jgi:hypothetical protein